MLGEDGFFRKLVEYSKSRIKETMKTQNIPGLSIAFYHEDYVYADGFGYADLEHKNPAGPETVYLLGSVMKTMTAQAIMKLSENRLKLDDEVQKHVPYYPYKRWPVTIRQILGISLG